MKKQTFLLWALAGMAAIPAHAQTEYETRAVVSDLKTSPAAMRGAAAAQADGAEYVYPVGLRNLGMISQDDNACCNFLSFNTVTNADAYMWAPMGETVTYIDYSTVAATDYHWFIPGADATDLGTQDADAVYNTPGVYPFPTMTVKDGAGKSYEYTAPGKIKVGGKGEICTSNMLNLGTDINDPATTAVVAQRPFGMEGSGWLGGTNALDLVGYGNLFMIAHPDASITGVRAYLPEVPMHEPGDTLIMQIWYPLTGESSIQLMGLPLEAVILPMDEIKPTTDTRLKNVAVAEFNLTTPLKIADKPFFFVTIEGFGHDPSKQNARLLIDIKPVQMDEATAGNLLAHNSFCRREGFDDYLQPINYFGAQLGESFMICPVLDTHTPEGSGVGSVQALKPGRAAYEGGVLSLSSEGAERAVVYNVGGERVVETSLDGGQAEVQARLAKGVYLVRFMKGGKVSGAAKLLCNE